VKARHDYLPFGEETGAGVGSRTAPMGYGAMDSTRQRFTSKERDQESGLDYFLARYYSSAQGRFTGVDPANGYASVPQDWNRYSYTLNNPFKYTDPSGEKWAVQHSNGQSTFRWYDGDTIPSDWEGKWEEYTAGWYIGADAVIKLGGRGPNDVLVLEKEIFLRTGGQSDWDKIQKADPNHFTDEEKEIIYAAATYYPDRLESFRKSKFIAELGAYLIASLVNPTTVNAPKYGATPKGRPYTKHYAKETGPQRNIPGSVVDEVIDKAKGVPAPGGKTVYYDPVNNITVVTGRGQSIVSVHKGRPGKMK